MSLGVAQVTLNFSERKLQLHFMQSKSNGSKEEVYSENWTSILRQWNEREGHDSQWTFPS